jgi:hypothetical protein
VVQGRVGPPGPGGEGGGTVVFTDEHHDERPLAPAGGDGAPAHDSVTWYAAADGGPAPDVSAADAPVAGVAAGPEPVTEEVPPIPAVVTGRPVARYTEWRSAAVVGLIVAALLLAGMVLLWGKVDDMSGKVDAVHNVSVTRVATINAAQKDIDKKLAALQATIAAVQTSVDGAAKAADVTAKDTDVDGKVAALTARADQLAACVNSYMDAIAGWTRNPTVNITYNRC